MGGSREAWHRYQLLAYSRRPARAATGGDIMAVYYRRVGVYCCEDLP